MQPPSVHEVVARFVAEDPLELGPSDPGEWAVRELQRRRYSTIHRLDPPARLRAAVEARIASPAVVLKRYRIVQPARHRAEYENLERVGKILEREPVSTVRPVACYPEGGAILTALAVGEPADRWIRRACRRSARSATLEAATAICERAGKWLRGFQRRAAVPDGGPSRHLGTPASFVAYLHERLEALAALGSGLTTEEATRLLQRAEALLQDRAPALRGPAVWAHADFGPHNLLVDGMQRLVVLDFELRPEHRYFDASYFCESIAQQAMPWDHPRARQALEEAFLRGWGGYEDAPLFVLLRMRHLLCTLLSQTRRRGWGRWRAVVGRQLQRRRLRDMMAKIETTAMEVGT